MNEAERRAAFEAAVVEALSRIGDAIKCHEGMSTGDQIYVKNAVASVRTIHDTEPDAPAATEAGA